jgi:transcriptional regulator with XRE-family HTH domain
MSPIKRSRRSATTSNGRRSRAVTGRLLTEFDQARRDAGLSLRQLSVACGVSQPHLSQILAGEREPSISVLTAIGTALGGDVSIRFYPTTGPAIHDRLQAPIVEESIRIAHQTWRRRIEVPVFRPARGFIDLVLDRDVPPDIVATEVQTRLDRLEQTLRWTKDKAASLPSSDLWRDRIDDPTVHRLLILRSTASTRELARRFEGTLRAEFPATAAAVYRALTENSPWPGHGILWADVRGDTATILDRPPRGIAVGR